MRAIHLQLRHTFETPTPRVTPERPQAPASHTQGAGLAAGTQLRQPGPADPPREAASFCGTSRLGGVKPPEGRSCALW